MIETFKDPTTQNIWLDVTAPTDEEFSGIAAAHGIDVFYFKECMNPEHFPRFDVINEKSKQMILRLFDETSQKNGDTVREITRKIAIFYSSEFIITVHQRDISWLTAIKPMVSSLLSKKNGIDVLVTRMIQEVIHSYEAPIQNASRQLEEFEVKIFLENNSRSLFQDLYLNRRRSVIYKEMIDQTALILNEQIFSQLPAARNSSILKRLKAETERLYFYSSKLHESVSYLINLHISLASHRTNEVMRVLTVFSAFFLPLTFIVGVYGMNFKNMPELEQPFGYYYVIGFMVMISVLIAFWFRRKGWLKLSDS